MSWIPAFARMTEAIKGPITLLPLLRFIFCAALLCVLAPFSAGALSITFKDEAFVKGPAITLSEVANLDGQGGKKIASMEVCPAPSPAATKRIDTATITARLQHLLDTPNDLEISGAKSVLVTTLHTEVERKMIADSLKKYIESVLPWDPLASQVEVELPAQDLVLPQGEIGFQWHSNPDYKFVGESTFRGTITVDGEVKKTTLCKATIEAYIEVFVAVNPIATGKAICPADLKKETRPLSILKDTPVPVSEDIGGFMAARAINPGEAITQKSIAPRRVIKRKQLVTVETRAGALSIQTQAQAETDGAVGDVITCTNANSKQTFQGTVRQDGVVVVE